MRRYHFLFVVGMMLPLSAHASDTAALEKTYENGIRLITTTKRFVPKEHKLKKCGDHVCLIDEKPAYGSDGKIPSWTVSRLVFEKDGKQVLLDTSSMYDPHVTQENIGKKLRVEPYWGDFFKVTGYFSDGAGTYICQWVVSSDGGIRMHISDVESLLELASKIQNDF